MTPQAIAVFGPSIDQPADTDGRCYENRQEDKFSEHWLALSGAVLNVSGNELSHVYRPIPRSIPAAAV